MDDCTNVQKKFQIKKKKRLLFFKIYILIITQTLRGHQIAETLNKAPDSRSIWENVVKPR